MACFLLFGVMTLYHQCVNKSFSFGVLFLCRMCEDRRCQLNKYVNCVYFITSIIVPKCGF